MICSIPRAPSFTGTPTNRPWMPYSPSRDAERFGDESTIARGVQSPCHADDAVARKAADAVSRLRHGVEGIGDHNQNALRRILDHLFDRASDDFSVGF